MTFNEMIDKLAEEMKDECLNNPEKKKIVEDLAGFYEDAAASGNKIDACKLFDLVDKFTKAFPEYTSAIIALSFMANIGMSDMEVITKNTFDEMNVEDIVDGINVEGED